MGARQLIDASVGGSMDSKTPQEVIDLIEHIAMNNYTWGSIRSRAKPTRLHSVDMISAIESSLATMIEKKMGI